MGQNTSSFSLSDWQTIFPKAVSLSQSIDSQAIQRCLDLGLKLNLPKGTAYVDIDLDTGGNAFWLRGEGTNITELDYYGTGSFLTHGTFANQASGKFRVSDLTIRPKNVANYCFNTYFSGNQSAWCHIISNVDVVPSDGTNYFKVCTSTTSIKRGLDWRNFVVYGRHGFTLSTDAHIFPPRSDNTNAGDSYNFDNCMTVGYNYGWRFDSTGFTSSTAHCHEEAQFYNCQSYSGVGLFQYLDTNTNTAPDDNWTFEACGWQGTGPAFNCQYLEFGRVENCLLVNNTVSVATDCFFRFVDCDDWTVYDNEVFCISGSLITGVRVSGVRTADMRFYDNDFISYASLNEIYYFDASLLDRVVDERRSSPRGTATYANGMVNDQSASGGTASQISELRVAQAIKSTPGVNPPSALTDPLWFIAPNGQIVYEATWITSNNDANGNVQLNWPSPIFKVAISAFVPSNGNGGITTISPVPTTTFSKTGGVVQYPGLTTANTANLTTRLRVIGR